MYQSNKDKLPSPFQQIAPYLLSFLSLLPMGRPNLTNTVYLVFLAPYVITEGAPTSSTVLSVSCVAIEINPGRHNPAILSAVSVWERFPLFIDAASKRHVRVTRHWVRNWEGRAMSSVHTSWSSAISHAASSTACQICMLNYCWQLLRRYRIHHLIIAFHRHRLHGLAEVAKLLLANTIILWSDRLVLYERENAIFFSFPQICFHPIM